jgi:TonB-dependent receptor
MQQLRSLLFLITCLVSYNVFAQTGTLRGKVIDDETGEALIGVTVRSLDGPGGGFTDLEGSFNASLQPGVQRISFEYIGYEKLVVEGVEIKANDVTVLDLVRLTTKAQSALKDAVTVTATRVKNTESALVTLQRKSVNVMDGISAQAFKKSGDGDAAAAIKRVTGVSVEDGKYVYVRGLGDRYTKTVLNGMELPGLDPDRNTLQMDIFPTNLVDNLVVLKTFTPNLSGDFTGGTVDVQTKDFQSTKVFGISASLGYNPAMNLTGDYLSHTGNIADVFAFGGSSRALPFEVQEVQQTLVATNPAKAEEFTQAFSKDVSAFSAMSLLNTSFNINAGNQFNKDKKVYGYNLAFGYSNQFQYYDTFLTENYLKSVDKTQNELFLAEQNNGSVGSNEVLWSALANGSFKKKKYSLSATLFHTQNGIKKSSDLIYLNVANPFGDAGAHLLQDILYYNQRSLTNLLLRHRYVNPEKKWEFETKLSPSFSTNSEPDMKITRLSIEDLENEQYKFNIGAGSEVARIYRNLFEYGINGKFDAVKTIQMKNDKETKLKMGAAYNYKNRDFSVYKYNFQPLGSENFNLNGDADQIYDELLYTEAAGEGFRVIDFFNDANIFDANLNLFGAYVMNELPLGNRFNAIYGVRVEQIMMNYTGENQLGVRLENERVLDELSVLPSASFVYRATANMNIRLAGSRTVARPSFKEKSNAQILDPITNRTFIGNLDLEQSDITNLDLRWEYYMQSGELISISGFYKHFINPIEIVAFKPETPNNFTPRNAESANVYGAELEIKKSLGFISASIKDLFLGTNISYIISEVQMTAPEILGRQNEARVGQVIGETRVMQGQAPYIFNVFLNYANKERGLNANVTYNVQGPQLAIVGIARVADVYTEPFHSLNFKASQTIGKYDNMQVSLSATNLLGDDRLQVYKSFEAQDQVFSRFLPQTTIKAGFSYNLK